MPSAPACSGSIVSSLIGVVVIGCAARAPATDVERSPAAPVVAAPEAPAPVATAPIPRPLAVRSSPGAASSDLDPAPARTLREQRAELFATMAREGDFDAAEIAAVAGIFAGSPLPRAGQPRRHPAPDDARASAASARAAAGLAPDGAPALRRAPTWCRSSTPTRARRRTDAKVCIDQFEFPDIACEYPVVYATRARGGRALRRGRQAHLRRARVGGRLRRRAARARGRVRVRRAAAAARPGSTTTTREMRLGLRAEKDHALCATGDAARARGCTGGGWTLCGIEHLPGGRVPRMREPVRRLRPARQRGRAHEPPARARRSSRAAAAPGQTEMKGSWFVFQRQEAHEDDCRWRAKDWHPSKVIDRESHRNYHLGFRCCADVTSD